MTKDLRETNDTTSGFKGPFAKLQPRNKERQASAHPSVKKSKKSVVMRLGGESLLTSSKELLNRGRIAYSGEKGRGGKKLGDPTGGEESDDQPMSASKKYRSCGTQEHCVSRNRPQKLKGGTPPLENRGVERPPETKITNWNDYQRQMVGIGGAAALGHVGILSQKKNHGTTCGGVRDLR